VSIKIMTRVWDARNITTPAFRLVLLKLADCANDAGERSFPAVPTIAADCELSSRQVQRALSWLREHGFIAQVAPAKHHRPAEWAVCLDAAGVPYTRTEADRADTPQGRHPVTPTPARQGRRTGRAGVTSTTVRGDIPGTPDYVPGSVIDPSVPVQAGGTGALATQADLQTPAHPIKALLTEHDRLFRLHVGQVPHYTGKDAKLAAQLIAQHGYDAVVAMLPALFSSLDPFVRQSGRDMSILSSCWNKLLVQAAPAVQMSENTTKTLNAGARWLAKQKEKS
jgi:hypothetical protein